MSAVMAERIRLIVDTEEVIRRAVRLRALRMGDDVTNADVVNGILRGDIPPLKAEIAEVEKYPQTGTGTAKKPGRKRKEGGGK